jgi:phage gp36-like protein
MAHHYLTQTWTGTMAGDLTNAVGNQTLARLFDNGSAGCDSTAGDSAIDDAEADADSILGPSFLVPTGTTTTAPRIVKRAVADMAVFYGYERAPEFTNSGGDNPQQKRYDRAVKLLKEIRNGERDMGAETAESKSGLTGGVVYYSTDQFITDDLEGTDGPTGPY